MNGSFVTDVDWMASKKAFGEAFEEKLLEAAPLAAEGVRCDISCRMTHVRVLSTSLVRNSSLLGPYSRPMHRVLRWF